MGSILKRGKTYYIRYEGDHRPDGSRRQVMQACPGMTYKQAQQLLRERESERAHGDFIDPSAKTLEEYLLDWLEHIKGTIADSTWNLYRLCIHSHIIPALGKMKLTQLTPLQIQQFYSDLHKTGANRHHKDKPLSPKTIKNIHSILHRALAQAVKWRLRSNNPAEMTELPKVTRPDVHATDQAGLHALIAAIEADSKWRLPVLIALATGMRRGEVLALQWQDWDEERNAVIVRRALSQFLGADVTVKGTKTDRTRVVLLPETIADELRKHREAAIHKEPADFICCDFRGVPYSPKAFTRAFARLASTAGVAISLHGLRHSHATALIAAGIPVKVVSERLGHSTVSITQDIYTHVLPTMQREAVNVFEQIMQPKEE